MRCISTFLSFILIVVVSAYRLIITVAGASTTKCVVEHQINASMDHRTISRSDIPKNGKIK